MSVPQTVVTWRYYREIWYIPLSVKCLPGRYIFVWSMNKFSVPQTVVTGRYYREIWYIPVSLKCLPGRDIFVWSMNKMSVPQTVVTWRYYHEIHYIPVSVKCLPVRDIFVWSMNKLSVPQTVVTWRYYREIWYILVSLKCSTAKYPKTNCCYLCRRSWYSQVQLSHGIVYTTALTGARYGYKSLNPQKTTTPRPNGGAMGCLLCGLG